MPLFKKKPVIIEAHQWFKNGDHPKDYPPIYTDTNGTTSLGEGRVVRYFRDPNMLGSTQCKYCSEIMFKHGWIDTLEGGHIVCPGDWIITGVHGERYPCKPKIFEKTYEPATEETKTPQLCNSSLSEHNRGPWCTKIFNHKGACSWEGHG